MRIFRINTDIAVANKSLIMRLKTTAMRMFVKGPAKETKARSFRPSRRLKGSTGTGFAAPKITGEPLIRSIIGNRMLIRGSMCFRGFNVNRPISRAVGSPSLSATNP